MWTWLKNCFEALLSYSPMALIIGIIITVLSVVDAFLSKKSGKERASSVVVAILSVLLLFVQGRSSEQAEEKSKKSMTEALQKQKDDLTGAFQIGTNQVIGATTQTAIQTRNSAKQQTDGIKQQAAEQFNQLQVVMLGTSTCPSVVVGNPTGGRPNQISVVNEDQKLNMYDVRLELNEYGPEELNPPNERWTKSLQYQVVNFPQIVPQWGESAPVAFLSKMTDIWVAFRLTTRNANCSGQIFLFDTGRNNWLTYSETMLQGNKRLSYFYKPLSPGLQKSMPDPQSSQDAPQKVP